MGRRLDLERRVCVWSPPGGDGAWWCGDYEVVVPPYHRDAEAVISCVPLNTHLNGKSSLTSAQLSPPYHGYTTHIWELYAMNAMSDDVPATQAIVAALHFSVGGMVVVVE